MDENNFPINTIDDVTLTLAPYITDGGKTVDELYELLPKGLGYNDSYTEELILAYYEDELKNNKRIPTFDDINTSVLQKIDEIIYNIAILDYFNIDNDEQLQSFLSAADIKDADDIREQIDDVVFSYYEDFSYNEYGCSGYEKRVAFTLIKYGLPFSSNEYCEDLYFDDMRYEHEFIDRLIKIKGIENKELQIISGDDTLQPLFPQLLEDGVFAVCDDMLIYYNDREKGIQIA